MKKKGIYSLIAFVLVFVFSLSFIVPIKEIFSLENGFLADFGDVENVNSSGRFGNFIVAKMQQQQQSVDSKKPREGQVVFKLFGLIPIRKVGVVLADNQPYYVGGVPIGLRLVTDGAIVVSDDAGTALKEGDIITHINGQPVNDLDEICALLNLQNQTDEEKIERTGNNTIAGKMGTKKATGETNGEKMDAGKTNAEKADAGKISAKTSAEKTDADNFAPSTVEVQFLRKNKPMRAVLKTIKDDQTGRLKLGLWVKDDVSGVGTLTFVNAKTHQFGALGHPIVESEGENVVPIATGDVFKCSLIGINKSRKNNPGQLKCVFAENARSRGKIDSNGRFGISGTLSDITDLVDENLTAPLGGRLGVKMGKAKIVSAISGIREEYDIEIIKANYQKSANDKSIVFRVKDKRLLDLAGGIVQGMSGSPIMQDGKIIGAVTHVFLNDPTKGYGVYADWMAC